MLLPNEKRKARWNFTGHLHQLFGIGHAEGDISKTEGENDGQLRLPTQDSVAQALAILVARDMGEVREVQRLRMHDGVKMRGGVAESTLMKHQVGVELAGQ